MIYEDMIPVECHTNVDDLRMKKWPTVMACRPIMGDRVQSQDGARVAYVVGITHATRRRSFTGEPTLEPILLVELHSRSPRT
jgi:hypothetical protein